MENLESHCAEQGVYPREKEMLTLQLLRDGAEPVQVDTVLAADTGGAAPEGMQWDGPNDKR